MLKKNVLRRRRLAALVRKRITSYYSEAEQQEIATAAAAQGISISAFVASAALNEARKTKSWQRSK